MELKDTQALLHRLKGDHKGMVQLKDYMNMTDEQLAAEEVGAGELDYRGLFMVVFPENSGLLASEDVDRFEEICNAWFDRDDSPSYGEELLRICHGMERCRMIDVESVADYLFTTPLDVMRMDLGQVYCALRDEYMLTTPLL